MPETTPNQPHPSPSPTTSHHAARPRPITHHQVARAAALVLRYTGSRADACAAAQALYLFGVMRKAPRGLFQRCVGKGRTDGWID